MTFLLYAGLCALTIAMLAAMSYVSNRLDRD